MELSLSMCWLYMDQSVYPASHLNTAGIGASTPCNSDKRQIMDGMDEVDWFIE